MQAYAAGEWTSAARSWEAVREAGLESSTLYYNIGNAYFKDGDIAHAILWYERALKLDPTNEDAGFNLSFARNQVQDKIEEIPEPFIEVIGHKMCRILPSDTWAVLAVVFFAVTLALVLLFLLGPTVRSRKTGFISGIVTLLVCLLCLDFAFSMKDPVSAAKVLDSFIDKEKCSALEIKGGLLGEEVMDVAKITALAKLPSREVLLGRLLGSMTNSISSFVRVVEAYRKKMAGEE